MRALVLVLFVCTSVLCIENIELKDFAERNNEFSTKLVQELISSNKNLIVSPLSAETILALTALGSKGATLSELSEALVLPPDAQKIKNQFRQVQSLMLNGRFSTLTSANKIYIENGFGIVPEYLNVATDDFGAGIENVNFADAEGSAAKINQWVASKTNGKIQNIISSDKLNQLTRVVLVNALYFKGQWFNPFQVANTKMLDFHKSKSETIQVSTMQTIARLKYCENNVLKAQFIELPYRGSEVSLTIVMPNEIDGISALEKQMSFLLKPQNYTRENIKLYLPSFKVESSFNLVPTLQQLGVTTLFGTNADLSGMSIKDGLYVSSVVQKVFIEVNEKGTEAAASTAVISNARSAISRVSKLEIKIDRPFLFFLKIENVVLFTGKIISP